MTLHAHSWAMYTMPNTYQDRLITLHPPHKEYTRPQRLYTRLSRQYLLWPTLIINIKKSPVEADHLSFQPLQNTSALHPWLQFYKHYLLFCSRGLVTMLLNGNLETKTKKRGGEGRRGGRGKGPFSFFFCLLLAVPHLHTAMDLTMFNAICFFVHFPVNIVLPCTYRKVSFR